MSVVYERFGVTVHHGDCLEILAALPDASVHAVVTDPPYGLEFMGKEWDSFRSSSARLRTRVDGRTNPREGKSVTTTPEAYVAGHPFQQWCEQWARECLRVLKPGGHMVAFGGSRTWHRLACAVEDAGFEMRDSIAWLYGTGFPKSHNLEGDRQGWGTALKPAFEPIVVGRKPFSGTVAATVLEHGTGALNIDACRIASGQDYRDKCASVVGLDSNRNGDAYGEWTGTREDSAHEAGRWPTNVVLTHATTPDGVDLCGDGCVPGCPVLELDEQSGQSSGARLTAEIRSNSTIGGGDIYSGGSAAVKRRHQDSGGASRFFPVFRWEAKAPGSERPKVAGVSHPTVKPLAFMRWLVRLVTPPDGIVLDPFLGSGTTAHAARAEGFRCIGVERESSYIELIRARLDARPQQHAAETSGAPKVMDLLDLIDDGGAA